MMIKGILLLVILISTSGFSGVPDSQVPARVSACVKSAEEGLEIDRRLNPFYLRGDFDGDGRPDYAVLVRRGSNRGIALCRGSSPKAITLGAGSAFNEMTDLDFTSWHIYDKHFVERGVGEGSPPKLMGKAIWIEWDESASALIYWNGRGFSWYQQGD
jgi:hypothetical protein